MRKLQPPEFPMSSPPLSVSDSQLDAILAATAPLPPPERSAFLVALAHRLKSEVELGDGLLFRVLRELQREFFRPPQFPKHSTPVHHAARGEPIE
jgi:hypothetical protein